jgi:spermidine synthase
MKRNFMSSRKDNRNKIFILQRENLFVLVLFFLSGFCGLVYEIAWIRKATLLFGATTLAVSSVISIFFAGLAIGAWFSGAWSKRSERPLRLYGFIEIVIGIAAAMTPLLFWIADGVFTTLYGSLGDVFWLMAFVRLVLVGLIVIVPAIGMGASLPMIVRYATDTIEKSSLSTGLLYALNTLGGVAGVFLCGLFLLPYAGITVSVLIGVFVNIGIGLVALKKDQISKTVVTAEKKSADPKKFQAENVPRPGKTESISAMIIFGSAGFCSLAFEILWTRFASLIIHNTVYTYTLSLGITLTGIVTGSFLAALLGDRLKNRLLAAVLAQLFAALVALMVFLLPASFWNGVIDTQSLWVQMGVLAAMMFIPMVLSGMIFPLALRMIIDKKEHAGSVAGSLVSINTACGIIGSLCAGFLLLPILGMQKSFLLVSGFAVVFGIVVLLIHFNKRKLVYGIWIAAALCVFAIIVLGSQTSVPRDFLAAESELVDYKEGLNATISLVKHDARNDLEIDRLWQGENQKNHQIMAAHIPMLLHASPDNVLVIGLGAGLTPSRFLYYPVNKLDCVDIIPELPDFVRRHFESRWMDDKRVRFFVDDGRNYVRHASDQYDLISIEVGQTFRPNLAGFYTVDFYRDVKKRLLPGGMVSQFVHLVSFNQKDLKSVIRSFITVFPQSVLWYNRVEMLLIGSTVATPQFDMSRFTQFVSQPHLYKDLSFAYWGGRNLWCNMPEVFLSGFIAGPATLDNMTKGAALFYDERPVLEYHVALNQSNEPDIDLLLKNRDNPHLVTSVRMPDTVLQRIEAIREKNIYDIIASQMNNNFERTRNSSFLFAAYKTNPDNFKVNLNLGIYYRKQNDIENAMKYFGRAATINPDDAFVQSTMGTFFMNLGYLDKAETSFKKALAIDPGDYFAYNNLGALFASKGRYDEAISCFEKAVSLQPDNADATANLARCRQGRAVRN